MNINDIVLRQVKYKIDGIVIYCGSTTFEVDPSMFRNLYIEKDYENTVMPYYQMTLNLPNWLYREMQRNSQDIRIGFNLKYGLFDDNNKKYQANMTTELGGKFYVLIGDSTVAADEGNLIQIEKEEGSYNTGYSPNEQCIVDMMLVNETYYRGLNRTANAVFSSCTPADALTYVLNQGGFNNILLSPPNNNSSYSQFKVTPIPIIDQVKRICFEYNLHNNGTVICFDLDRGYIIDKQPKCTAYVTNEYMTTNLMSFSTHDTHAGQMGGFYIEKTDKTYIVNMTEDSFTFEDQTNTANTSSIQVIDTISGSVSTVSTGASMGGTQTYTYSNGANTASQIAKNISESQSILTLSTSSCIISALNPNKTFNVSIDNTKSKYTNANGNYRISSMVCNLSPSGEYLVPIIKAIFKK